ncbi:MAG: adenine phosphoribosyltransferase [Candidatus Gracilibacteria bacterium]|nr:adenine phosphoribosyltransferase [Candidatus Gracilibacteria bacterium]MDQ7022648.1 adenine phosphoribosyltransferase [Candidatus Gracilibacteria bacterium]
MDLKKYISEISDFPKKGINFKDMSPILEDSEALHFAINSFEIANAGKINKIVGLDARGFIFGSILAYKMKLPFIMLRKAGKLPGICESISYDLEYGSNTFEIQKSAINPGDKIAIVDDLLATGGSAKTAIDLIEKLGGIIESLNFVIELGFLNGKEKFENKKVVSLVKY